MFYAHGSYKTIYKYIVSTTNLSPNKSKCYFKHQDSRINQELALLPMQIKILFEN